jgi:hypothetical protein
MQNRGVNAISPGFILQRVDKVPHNDAGNAPVVANRLYGEVHQLVAIVVEMMTPIVLLIT